MTLSYHSDRSRGVVRKRNIRIHLRFRNCVERMERNANDLRCSQNQDLSLRVWLRDAGRSPVARAVSCGRSGRIADTNQTQNKQHLHESVCSETLRSGGNPFAQLVIQSILFHVHRTALPPPGESIAHGLHFESYRLMLGYEVFEYGQLVVANGVALDDAFCYD